jgi:hypothetical protein
LYDGCTECEVRGKRLDMALAHMDDETFARAWKRAYEWKVGSGVIDVVGPISDAEYDLLNVLWGLQVILGRFGVPLNGEVPEGVRR